ncbi:hypothetical protein JB92DRAFT_3109633 [Gautieria morchelliformis]|nr:hypothetical protein JB92DRAFT_3109633 [Gautieria morchelliformis]
MSEQGEILAKLSKSQKKKRAAQKKKLAKTIDRASEEKAAEERAHRLRDELDARTVEQLHDQAMHARDFQMLNIRGKLLAHPAQSFLKAFTTAISPRHGQRALPSLSVAMGTASYIPINKFLLEAREEPLEENSPPGGDGEGKITMFRFAEPVKHGRKGAFTDTTWGALGLMVWYPILAACMECGDKLACIAIRDTCVVLRTCYGIFRNDITRLEQFVFDMENPSDVRQLEWVARRVEVPPSPPQTPPQTPRGPEAANGHDTRDPFRSPVVLAKRWSDYDDDDESLGSPMVLPITPESSSDVPALDLGGCSEGAGAGASGKRRAPTTVVAVPSLGERWFTDKKTILPTPRISLFIPESCPRASQTSSVHRMKLQSCTMKQMPGAGGPGPGRGRGRVEQWVREDAERRLRAKLMLTSAGKKKAEVEAENVIYNRMAALAGLDTGETSYVGESDILGAGRGVCVGDIRDVLTERYRGARAGAGRVVLVPSTEGWVCTRLEKL